MREWDGERREKEYRNWEGRNRRVIITRHIKTRGGHVLLQGYEFTVVEFANLYLSVRSVRSLQRHVLLL